jgi:hypothetical protein
MRDRDVTISTAGLVGCLQLKRRYGVASVSVACKVYISGIRLVYRQCWASGKLEGLETLNFRIYLVPRSNREQESLL